VRQIKGQALSTVPASLGLDGQGPEPEIPTEFEDKRLIQTYVANQAILRGRTLAGSEGMFSFNVVLTSVGASVESLVVDPYEAGAAATVFNGYPSPVVAGFDAWLFHSTAFPSGAGLITDGYIRLVYPGTKEGFGTAASGSNVIVAAWSDEITLSGALWMGVGTDPRSIGQSIGWRVPRGVTIQFIADHAAAGSFTFQGVLGLFPSSLGQDVRV